MDKRKLMLKTSLHKNLQLVDQSLKKVTNNEQTSSSSSNDTIIQDKIDDLFDGDKRSTVKSTLKLLNGQPTKKNLSIESRKRNFRDIDKDVSEKSDFTTGHKLLNAKTLKQLNSQVSTSTVSAISQQENIHLAENRIARSKKLLSIPNSSVEKSTSHKRKVSSSNSAEEISDNDFDFLHNECTVIKKKRNKIEVNKNVQHVTQDIGTNHQSPRKTLSLIHRSPIKPITKSNISPKKQQDQSKELYLSESLEKHSINNKQSEKGKSNTKEFSLKEQSFHMSILTNLLKKCGIVLSIDDTHVLSKFIIHIYFLINTLQTNFIVS